MCKYNGETVVEFALNYCLYAPYKRIIEALKFLIFEATLRGE